MNKIVLFERNIKHREIIASHMGKQGYEVFSSGTIPEFKQLQLKASAELVVISIENRDDDIAFISSWLNSVGTGGNNFPVIIIASGETQKKIFKVDPNPGLRFFSKPLDISAFNSALDEMLRNSFRENKLISDYSKLIGKKIGSVIIEKEIARGGMGVVLLGHQQSLDRKVAVKILLAGEIEDKIAMERFEREARATALLKSPHIVQIYDFGKIDEGTFYIIMEYLPGETIQQFIYSRTRISIKESVSIIRQVAEGLKVAHDSGLIHRDIKPSNIMINRKGDVTITDFGLVKPLKKVTETIAGAIFGTPMYISPDQINSLRLDPRTDIYSLGIIFYQLLTGEAPFSSPNPVELMMKHLKEDLPEITEKNSEISPEIRKIVLKMTKKNRDERYNSCRELINDLDSLSLRDTEPYLTDVLETPTGAQAVQSSRIKEKRDESSRIFTSSIEKVPEKTMKKIEEQLAYGIGPIAKVVLKKEIKKMGFAYDSFPKGSIIPLIEKLTTQIKDNKRDEILKNVEDIIFTQE